MWVGLQPPICGLPLAVGPLPAFLACDIFGFSVSVRRTDNDDESTSLLHKGRAEGGEVDHPSIHLSDRALQYGVLQAALPRIQMQCKHVLS